MTLPDDPREDDGRSGWKLCFSDGLESELVRAEVRRELFPNQVDTQEPQTIQLGRYQVVRRIGRGGMGTVYLARDPALARDVAVKILHDTSEDSAGAAHSNRRRIHREAIALGQLTHANVVRVYDVGEDEGRTYVAMEYVRGGTLRDWQRSHRADRPAILRAYAKAGRGLAAAHAAGLLHRDFKPDNVLVDADDRVLVSDFGLVRLALPVTTTRASVDAPLALDDDITRTGALLGTPAYMAPELFDGHGGDASSDQFAFCVALFEALVGRRPLDDEPRSRNQGWASLASVEHDALHSLPGWLRGLLLRGLHPDPRSRFPDMDALLERLNRGLGSRRRHRIAVLGSLGALAFATAVAGLAPDPRPAHPLCGLDDPSASVHSSRRHSAIAAAYQAAEMPESAARVHARFEARVRSWADEVDSACAPDPDRSEALRARQLECLQARQRDLDALGGLLQSVDAGTAATGLELVSDPQRLLSCQDERALRGRVPPPRDRAWSARVARRRDALARGSLQLRVGQFERARVIARDVRASAEAEHYPPLAIEADYLDAQVLQRSQHRSKALTALRTLELAAEAQGHDRIALAASVLHLELLVDEHRPPAEVQARIERARARALRLGDDVARVNIEFSHAALEQRRGHLERALQIAESALELAETRLGVGHPEVAYAHDYVGGALSALQRYDAALEHKRRAIAVLERAYGPDAVGLSVLLNTAGSIARLAGRHTLAQRWHGRAVANLEARLGPDSPQLAEALGAAAVGALARGAADEALVLLRRQLALQAAQGIVSHTARRAEVDALVLGGDLLAAAEVYRDAMRTLDAAGPDATVWDRADTLRAGAQLALLRGDLDTAERRARRSVDASSTRPTGRVYPLVVLAQVELARHRLGPAAATLDRAERDLGDGAGHQPLAVAELHRTRLELARAGSGTDLQTARAQALVSVRRARGPLHPVRVQLERSPPP